MIPEIGHFMLWLALALSLALGVVPLVGAQRGRRLERLVVGQVLLEEVVASAGDVAAHLVQRLDVRVGHFLQLLLGVLEVVLFKEQADGFVALTVQFAVQLDIRQKHRDPIGHCLRGNVAEGLVRPGRKEDINRLVYAISVIHVPVSDKAASVGRRKRLGKLGPGGTVVVNPEIETAGQQDIADRERKRVLLDYTVVANQPNHQGPGTVGGLAPAGQLDPVVYDKRLARPKETIAGHKADLLS